VTGVWSRVHSDGLKMLLSSSDIAIKITGPWDVAPCGLVQGRQGTECQKTLHRTYLPIRAVSVISGRNISGHSKR
jgi:hypothetical protein